VSSADAQAVARGRLALTQSAGGRQRGGNRERITSGFALAFRYQGFCNTKTGVSAIVHPNRSSNDGKRDRRGLVGRNVARDLSTRKLSII
jgi:hypothetical protein